MAEDISKLVAQSYVGQSSRTCWARTLDKRGAEYVAAIEAKGKMPNFAATSRILAQHFGVKISASSIANHFQGTCSCKVQA